MLKEQEQRDLLSAYLPAGPLWDAKDTPGSVFYRLLSGLCQEIVRSAGQIKALNEELDIRSAEKLLPQSEKMWGLPNKFISIAPTLTERRANLSLRIAIDGISTAPEVERTGKFLGFKITIRKLGERVCYPPYSIAHPLVGEEESCFIIQVKLGDMSAALENSVRYYIDTIIPAYVRAIYTK